MDLIIRPAGQEQEPLLKRLNEARAFTVDCSVLMGNFEIFVKVLEITANGIEVTGLRASGSTLTLSIGGGSVSSSPPRPQPFKDFPVTVTAQTNLGTLQVSLLVRVVK